MVSQLGMLPGTIVYINAGSKLSNLESVDQILTPHLDFINSCSHFSVHYGKDFESRCLIIMRILIQENWHAFFRTALNLLPSL